MTEDADHLAQALLHLGLVTESQLELALADHEVDQVPFEEIVLARGWLDEATLYQLAPWLEPGSTVKAPWTPDKSETSAAASSTKASASPAKSRPAQAKNLPPEYQANLQKYRAILKEIVGKDID